MKIIEYHEVHYEDRVEIRVRAIAEYKPGRIYKGGYEAAMKRERAANKARKARKKRVA